ncbi:putative bifunctional diguanylate cyclase/phosphodiesterase [Gudongella sp. SC589]|jgi:PAS domain S-box-containing protein|uniref:putative bifunctional diguanylate cyclase/phosphodiesterase n=1 Tax=Gudongella sp. SC589 TaxID=3385990 RepID=UPI003904850D
MDYIIDGKPNVKSITAMDNKIEKLGKDLMEKERLFRTLFEQANLGITIGHNGSYMEETLAGSPTINKKFQEIVGRSYEELLKIGWENITHPDDVQMDRENFLRLWRGEIDDFQMEKRYIKPDGSHVWVDMKICRLILDKLEGFNYICFVEDISKRKQNEQKLMYIYEHDPLTGLYNRRYFSTYIEDMDTVENSVAILANIKNFSLLNLTYGYGYAEELIQSIGKSLSELQDSHTKVFHISIDRFIVLLEKVKDRGYIESISWEIVSRMDESMPINTIHGYLGILELGEVGRDVDRILKYSSIAAKTASDRQEGRFCLFSKEMERKILRRERIQENIAGYVDGRISKGLFMEYQPIIDARTLDVHGFEALARFNSPQLGLVPPNEFIEIAESNKLIVPLGRDIMRQSFSFLNSLEERGYNDIFISINISIIQLLRDDFIPDLIQASRETGISLDKVNLELTESIFSSNITEINTKLSRLKQLGIETAIDDFGTGYSSLSRERDLDISCLKIDKAFIDKLDSTNEGDSITSDIISLAHKLGHVVVAEGVETENQMNYLIKNKCDYFQGYYFSKPLSGENSIEFIRKLRNNGM